MIEFDVIALPTAFPGFVSGFYGLLINGIVFVAVSLIVGGVSEETLEDTQGYIDYAISREWETGGEGGASDD